MFAVNIFKKLPALLGRAYLCFGVNNTSVIIPSNRLILRRLSTSNSDQTSFTGYIPLDQLNITYNRSSGPGGQHVNTSETKVEVRFHVPSATWIPENVRTFLMEKQERHRINKDGYFSITSERTRKQMLNQADCLERIRRMIRLYEKQLVTPPLDPDKLEEIQNRKALANEKRLREKKSLSLSKQARRSPTIHDY